MVAQGDYGVVRFERGDLAGQLGYYDDDVSPKRALVYMGAPFVSERYIVPRRYLRRVGDDHPQLTDWIRDHPTLAAQLGVRS